MGRKFRPIEKETYSEDRIAQDMLALSTGGKFTKGPEVSNRLFASASAGTSLGGHLGGGTFSPAHPSAGHVAKNGTATPVYPS